MNKEGLFTPCLHHMRTMCDSTRNSIQLFSTTESSSQTAWMILAVARSFPALNIMIFPQEHTDIVYILQDVLALLTISYQALPSHSRSFSARSSIHCHQQCQGKKPRYSSHHGCDVARPRAKMIQSRNLSTSKSQPSV